jgi:molybdopterin-guanine dinucleotide biosynthesis protein A
MAGIELLQVAGYVLAGGKSSRMGCDKALVELAGRPLIAHSTEKLRAICAEVAILSDNDQLTAYGRLVRDLRPGCGPLGGIEAALAESMHDWNLLVPVDVPFLPVPVMREWAARIAANPGLRASYFEVGGKAHPSVLLIHRAVAPLISAAVDRGEYKLLPVLAAAACDGLHVERMAGEFEGWFGNLNTPEELEWARRVAGGGLQEFGHRKHRA